MYLPNPLPRRRRAAFTLIELLVVVGVIALLIAILLPTLGKVRETARAATCMSNMSQIAKASTAYSMKYSGFLIPGYANVKQKISNGNLADAENYATMLVNEQLVDAPTLETLGSAIETRASVFRCPEGADAAQWTTWSLATDSPINNINGRTSVLSAKPLRLQSVRSGKVVDTWYGINSTIREYSKIKAPYRRVPDDSVSSYSNYSLYTMSDLKDASRTVFLFDGIFSDLQFDADRLGARHGGQRYTNLAFSDGHVECVRTDTIPGGMGPNTYGTDMFTEALIGPNPTYVWRLK